MVRPVAVLLALCALSVAPAQARTRACTFNSGGKPIRVEVYEPEGAGKLPAVLLLHGFDGPEGKHYRALADGLARVGHVVFLVHYHGSTCTKKEQLPGLCKAFQATLKDAGKPMPPRLRKAFLTWKAAARDALAFARKYPRVDGERVGALGISAGGFLATALASDPANQLNCVVECFGGIPREFVPAVKQFPPTLILHGSRDEVVPASEAEALARLLKGRKLPFEMTIYDGVGHCFVNDTGDMAWRAALDAHGRTVDFFERHLGTPATNVTTARAAVPPAAPAGYSGR